MDYNIGYELRYFCEKYDYSVEKVSSLLDCPCDLIETWFKGVNPEPKYLAKIADKMPISLCKLFGINDTWFEERLNIICELDDFQAGLNYIHLKGPDNDIPSVYTEPQNSIYDIIKKKINKSALEISKDLSISKELVQSWENGFQIIPEYIIMICEKYDLPLTEIACQKYNQSDLDNINKLLMDLLKNHYIRVTTSPYKIQLFDEFESYKAYLQYEYNKYDKYKDEKINHSVINKKEFVEELFEVDCINHQSKKGNLALQYGDYYLWLNNNENKKDSIYYQAVMLMCSYSFFINNEYSKSKSTKTLSDKGNFMYSDDFSNIDFIYKSTMDILKKAKLEDFEDIGFDCDSMNIIKCILSPSKNKLYISNGEYNFNNYKELITRKYIRFYISQWNTIYNEQIKNAIKELEIYKLLMNNNESNTEVNINFIDKTILEETSLAVYDSPFMIIENKSEYFVFDELNGMNKLSYKNDFDRFCFELLSWMYERNVDEFDELQKGIYNYLNSFKSRHDKYSAMLVTLGYKKMLRDSLGEINENSYFESIISKLSSKALDKSIVNSIEKEIHNEFKLEMEEVKKINSNWYEFLIIGQYYYSCIAKSFEFNDYSASVSLWCKCVEDMACKIIYEPLKKCKNPIIEERFDVNKSKEYTLGTIKWFFYDIDDNSDLLKIAKNELHYKADLKAFLKLMEGIKELVEYRNRAAHRFGIDQVSAEKCKEILFFTSQVILNFVKNF